MSIQLDHEAYNEVFEHFGNSRKTSSGDIEEEARAIRMKKLIKYGLLGCGKKGDGKNKCRILNVGSGPSKIVESFIDFFLDISSEIVLCEVNPYYIKSYYESDWYIKNRSQIRIYSDNIEDLFLFKKLKESSFNLIWCNHVIYYFRLKNIPRLLLNFNKLLINDDNSYIVISVTDDDGPLVKNIFNKLKPKYRLSHYVKHCIEKLVSDGEKYFEIKDYIESSMKKEEIINLVNLFVKEDVYSNSDYNSNDKCQISVNDENNIKSTIDQQFNSVATPIGNDKYMYVEQVIFYFIKKFKAGESVMVSKL